METCALAPPYKLNCGTNVLITRLPREVPRDVPRDVQSRSGKPPVRH